MTSVPAAAIPTYNALADHAHNPTGECWPMMETLARILGRTAKTIQRHLRLLEEAGLVEVLERRRDGKGRFLGFKFRLPHLARAAARIRDRRERNQAAYEFKKKERQEAIEARRQRRAEGRPGARNAGEASSGHSPDEARQERAQERRRGYEWLCSVRSPIRSPHSPLQGPRRSPIGEDRPRLDPPRPALPRSGRCGAS